MACCGCTKANVLSMDDKMEEVITIPSEEILRLVLIVVGARGVRRGDWFPGMGQSGCQCTVRIQGQDNCLFMTNSRQNDRVEPLWREEVDIAVPSGQTLEFGVWDVLDLDTKGPEGSARKLIGLCSLSREMYQHGFNGELPLQGALWGDATTSYLSLKVRRENEKFPPGLEPTFKIKFTRGPELPLGLDVDMQDRCKVFVSDIKFGPFQFYNLNAPEDQRLLPGYLITTVNGQFGNSDDLVQTMKKETCLDITVRRTVEMTIAVDKRDKRNSLGLEFASKGAVNNVLIMEVFDGPVKKWNTSNPSFPVQPGDRVIAVNGQRGKASELRKKMKDLERFLMTVVRPCIP